MGDASMEVVSWEGESMGGEVGKGRERGKGGGGVAGGYVS